VSYSHFKIGNVKTYTKISRCFKLLVTHITRQITLPPWPIYRKDPITWQPPTPEGDGTISSKNKSSKKKNWGSA